MNSRVPHPGFGACLLAGALCLVGWLAPPASVDLQAGFLYAVSALGLELVGARLQPWGSLSLAGAAYFATALDPDLGAVPAAGLMVAMMTLREVLVGLGPVEHRWNQSVAEALPILLTMAVLVKAPPSWSLGLALLVYVGAGLSIPSLFIDRRRLLHRSVWALRRQTLPFLIGGVLLGWLLSRSREQPHEWMVLLLVTGILAYALPTWVQGKGQPGSRRLASELDRRDREVETLERELSELQDGLLERSHQRLTLSESQRLLSQAKTVPEASRVLLGLCRRYLDPSNSALFLCRAEGLVPKLALGPQAERFLNALKLSLSEPAVEQAWREGQPVHGAYGEELSRCCPSEPHCLAVPLLGFGVLFLSRPRSPFSHQERELANLIGRQAVIVLNGLAKSEAQSHQLAYASAEKRKLARWLFRLERLLTGSRALFSAATEREVFSRTREAVDALIPHQGFYLFRKTPSSVVDVFSDSSPSELVMAAESALRGRVAVVLHEPDPSRLPLPENVESLVALPVGEELVVLVCGNGPNRFDREHLELLELLGQQVSVALERLKLSLDMAHTSKAAAIGQMAAGISHELNTPLAVAQLAIESAASLIDDNPERTRGHLQEAERAVHRIEQIVNHLTSFGLDDPVRQPLRELVNATVEKFEVEAELEVKELVKDLAVTVHALAFQQALHQVLLNAAEAAGPAGKIVVQLSGDSRFTAIEVHDNGGGIPLEIRDRVVEPFFTTRPLGEALGLGLSICERVVREHGGRLEFDQSGLGGACVRLLLPSQGRWTGLASG